MNLATGTVITGKLHHGFFGSAMVNYAFGASEAEIVYDATARRLVEDSRVSIEKAKSFLDSRQGLHFSSELAFLGARPGISQAEFMELVDRAIAESKWVRQALSEQTVY